MPGSEPATDACLSAFSDRAPLSAAWTWLDRQPDQSTPEVVPLAEAAGRVLAAPVTINPNTPNPNTAPKRAAKNGYAVRAADCDGAGDYNPLALPLTPPGADTLPPGHAGPISSGLTLPSGADAVLPLEAAQLTDASTLLVMAPVAPGTAVEQSWSAGLIVLDRGQRIGPKQIACLAAMNVEHLSVLSRPRVALVIPGAKHGADVLTPMLSALLARDGALPHPVPVASAREEALTAALTHVGDCAFVLIAGRAGFGPDDVAAGALKAAGGRLALHGLALRPGEVTGMGTIQPGGRAVPVVLLPGEPVACLAAYDMVAARLTQRFAGAGTDLPYPVAEFELGRKIVSGISVVDVVPVCLTGGRAIPVGMGAGLPAMVQADGFVVVPESSEGYKETTRVRVHLYDTRSAVVAPNIGQWIASMNREP